MIEKSLIDYVKRQLNQGYDINSIKGYLLRSGYSSSEINKVMEEIQGKKVHFTEIMIIVVVIVIVFLSAILFVFLYSGENDGGGSFKYMVDGVSVRGKPGGQIVIAKQFSDFDNNEQIMVSHEVIDVGKGETLFSKQESGVLSEIRGETTIDIVQDIEPGRYILKSTAIQGDKKSVATLTIWVYEEEELPENDADEVEDIDEPIEECPESCDDGNDCTEDICGEETDFECDHKDVVPCCGNLVCEEGEDIQSCTEDCEEEQPAPATSKTTVQEEVEDIKSKVLKNPSLTYLCNELEKETYSDYCYTVLAEALNKHAVCDNIVDVDKRDVCYMDHMINNNEFLLCEKIEDKHLKDSCVSLNTK